MPHYMVQSMSSGALSTIVYYRRQSSAHVTHAESGGFTQDAINNYAQRQHIAINQVVEGRYRSGQGRPNNPNAEEI